jgi:hypothetical protein
MTTRSPRRGFAARPSDHSSDPDAWVRAPSGAGSTPPRTDGFTARLTIDVTPALRGQIKIAAFARGLTVADMVRQMLEREFGDDRGGGV